MGNFDESLIVVNDQSIEARPASLGVADRLLAVAGVSQARLLYFHPRVYRLRPEDPLPRRDIGRLRDVRVLEFPERHTLWFARGAVLQLDPGVVVIIRGSIRSDPTQIFDLPEVRERRIRPASSEPSGLALVRFESTRMEEVYPEWFGVVSGFSSTTPADGAANAAAYQACLHAAVRDRDRDGVSLPPLSVLSRGVFALNETLEVLPDVNGRGALWLVGTGDATRRGRDLPSLNRYPRGHSRFAREPNAAEDDRSALLRLDARVSAEISSVGFRCFPETPGERTARDVAHALLIEESAVRDADVVTRARNVRLERCGLTGGRDAVLGLRSLGGARSVTTTAAATPYPRVPLRRAASRYSAESCVFDAVLSDSGGVNSVAPLPTRSARRIVHLESSVGAFFVLTSSLVFQTKGAYFDISGRPFTLMDLDAGIWMKGVSSLIRAVSFHLGEGPRPSRVAPPNGGPEGPDGQDLWLASSEDGPAPHVTLLHADSQSWWHLGADPIRRRRPGAVCLLNVGAGDVNLRELEGFERGNVSLTGMNFTRPGTDAVEAWRLYTPPSLWWPDSEIPLVLVACAFRRYAVRQSMRSLVMNVGSSFNTVLTPSRSTWHSPLAVPRPLPGDPLAGVREGRPIPEYELVGDPWIAQGLPTLVAE